MTAPDRDQSVDDSFRATPGTICGPYLEPSGEITFGRAQKVALKRFASRRNGMTTKAERAVIRRWVQSTLLRMELLELVLSGQATIDLQGDKPLFFAVDPSDEGTDS